MNEYESTTRLEQVSVEREEGITSHAIVLSNGRVLLVVEDAGTNEIGIGIGSGPAETHGHEVEAWICSIESGGVLVMPNSGAATGELVYKPMRRRK